MNQLAENLKALMQRSHGDMMNYLCVADMAQMSARQQHNMDRMDAQVDAQLKSCNPHYIPPESGTGPTIINDGVMSNAQFEALQNGDDADMPSVFVNAGIMVDPSTANNLINSLKTDQPPPANPPQQQPPQLPQQQLPQSTPPPKSTLADKVKQQAAKLIPLLIATSVGVAAARYFAPVSNDSDTQYEIETIPYIPPEQSPSTP